MGLTSELLKTAPWEIPSKEPLVSYKGFGKSYVGGDQSRAVCKESGTSVVEVDLCATRLSVRDCKFSQTGQVALPKGTRGVHTRSLSLVLTHAISFARSSAMRPGWSGCLSRPNLVWARPALLGSAFLGPCRKRVPTSFETFLKRIGPDFTLLQRVRVLHI